MRKIICGLMAFVLCVANTCSISVSAESIQYITDEGVTQTADVDLDVMLESYLTYQTESYGTNHNTLCTIKNGVKYALDVDKNCYYVAGFDDTTKDKSKLEAEAFISNKPVVAIKFDAFKDCAELKEVVLPDTVVALGTDCFSGCRALTSIKLSSNLRSISSGALSGCCITNIELPDSITTLDASIFTGSFYLRTVKIPNTIKKIDETSFIFTSCSIKYDGTINDWKNIEVVDWEEVTCGKPTIICKDGIIPGYSFGKCDDDSEVTSNDALYLLERVTGLAETDFADTYTCDIDRDDAVTSTDALYILQYIVGLIKDPETDDAYFELQT